jgi:hypothetical protein
MLMIRRNIYKLAVALIVSLSALPCNVVAQNDIVRSGQYVMRTVQYGVGSANVYDTYLSPQEYCGIDFRVMREVMRMSRWADSHISVQNMLQADVSYTHNRADNNNTLSGLVNWNYGLHYQFQVADGFKILAGAVADMNLGFIYNMRNGNNPASARAFVNLDASTAAIWHIKVKNYPLTLRYQFNLPFIGAMFSPHYGQSYYEIFTLGNTSGVVRFTSFHNQPSLRQIFSVDMPVGRAKMRLSYVGDMEQAKVNGIRSHYYSHAFMVGFVRNMLRIDNRREALLPASAISAY